MDEPAFFAAHGWMIFRQVVSQAAVRALSEEVDRIFPASLAASDRVHEQAGGAQQSPLLGAQVRDQGLAARVAALLACPRVQLLQDTVLVKPPRSPARVEWHQDHTYTGFLDAPAQVSVRLALTPCNRASGCLRVLDGSHALGPRGPLRALRADAVGDDSAHLPEGFEDRVLFLELEPGDISVHHCLTFHGSLANTTAEPRKTLVARLFDARCKLVPTLLPDGLRRWFPTDDEGHLTGPAFPLL